MIHDVLQPHHVNLALAAKDKAAAIAEVLAKLNGDVRVTDFAVLEKAVNDRNAPALDEGDCGILLAHGRTESVNSLVMAAGRSAAGFQTRDCPSPIHLIFVAGIPAAFNSDYLRIVGAIARTCRDRQLLDRLLAAKTGEEFVQLLTAAELKL